MDKIPEKPTLDLMAASLLTGLCMLWGFNGVAIKISNLGISPIFGAGIRSVIATLGLIFWMKLKNISLFPGKAMDGLVVGVLFGLEFGLLYSSLLYTTASSAWVLLYTTPFFHAVGAHFLLKGDRLSLKKGIGLILAFAGIILLLSKHLGVPSLGVPSLGVPSLGVPSLGVPSSSQLMGDMMALGAAFLWAVTTIYVKRRLVGKVAHHHTLFYQTIFSIPILFFLSVIVGEEPIRQINGLILLSVAYQGVAVAFISYLLWFFLVHSYPVSRLSAFTFLTPVFATFAGVVFLHELLTFRLILSLILVSFGIYIINLK